MTPVHRTIAALRLLCRLHGDTGQVPVVELNLLVAELATTEQDRPTEWPDTAQRSDLELNPHGYPRGLALP
ncbi:hypothetical protein SAMN05444166_0301 [Singulisphaera sp. GP187]|uniref:hypothetical protein n=1 Tax=Singulisphaera sp. GP187 TaxID=1882752 RepID=UPI00092A548C|nr:hypothetical protein [Singulisphaera sp. GP187]SIN70870.1 hypothetical protein SAMN05444166_0301 [Singulisphaera sp. GP187]